MKELSRWLFPSPTELFPMFSWTIVYFILLRKRNEIEIENSTNKLDTEVLYVVHFLFLYRYMYCNNI